VDNPGMWTTPMTLANLVRYEDAAPALAPPDEPEDDVVDELEDDVVDELEDDVAELEPASDELVESAVFDSVVASVLPAGLSPVPDRESLR
jgi:hypothetical protein